MNDCSAPIQSHRLSVSGGLLIAIVCLFFAASAIAEETAEVRIAAGEFSMGTDAGTGVEAPVHTIYLDAFFIDRFEVTNEAYRAQNPDHTASPHSACGRCPATRVNWFEASAYCEAQGKRLPTEAEWEKAARGPKGWDYAFGERPDTQKGRFGRTVQAGAVPAGELGVFGYGIGHQSGNVWEWVHDWFGAAYYADSPQKNPKGPPSGFRKSVRGGSWYNAAYYVHTGMRFALKPEVKLDSVGFRCARDAP